MLSSRKLQVFGEKVNTDFRPILSSWRYMLDPFIVLYRFFFPLEVKMILYFRESLKVNKFSLITPFCPLPLRNTSEKMLSTVVR